MVLSAIMMTLMEYLKEKRMTQAEFARLTKDSIQNVNRYVHGRTPSKKKVISIDKFTGGMVSFADWYKKSKPYNGRKQPRREAKEGSEEIMRSNPS
jgi:transcriptional regulator with XRE-family HTH domain